MVMFDAYTQANALAMSLKQLRAALQRTELYPPLRALLTTPDHLKACINWWNKCLEDKTLDDETLNTFSVEWQSEIISKIRADSDREFNLYRDLLQFIITQIPLIKNLYHYPHYLRSALQANEPWYHAQTYSKQMDFRQGAEPLSARTMQFVHEHANGDDSVIQNPSMKNKWDEDSLYGLLWAAKQDLRHEVIAILESIPPSQAQIKAEPLRQAICTRLYQPGHPDRAVAHSLAKEIAVLQDLKPLVKNIQTWLNQFTQPVAAETPSPDRILFWQGNEFLLNASLQVVHKAALFQANSDFILQYHPQTGELKPANQCLPADRRHVVLPLPSDRPVAYAKFFPDAPGNEIAVSLLHDLLIGHGAPMTSLARFLPGTLQQVLPYPVLFSEAVRGPTLEEVLTKNQPLNLEPEHYSDMVFMAMLTIPFDGKPANYIVETIAGTTLHRLVSVDNALSFGLPVTKQVTRDGYQLNLQLISILFCFDEMRQIVHCSSRKRWLALDSHALLQTWLNSLVTYNQHCFVEGKLFPAKACQHWHDHDPEQSALLPFLLLPETITDVYRRLKQLQSFLDKNPACTHEDLLDSLLPHVKTFYAPCWEQIALPVRDRFIQLGEQHNSIEICHLPSSVTPALEEAMEAPEETVMISSRRILHLEQSWLTQIPTKLLSDKKDLVSFISHVKAQANQYQQQLNRLELRYGSLQSLRAQLLHPQANWTVILRELQNLQTLIPEVLESVLNGEEMHSMRVKISQLSPSIQQELFSIMNGIPFRRLYLSGCTLLTSGYLNQLLKSNPYLEALDVSGCIQLKEADITNIGVQCQKLKALNISILPLKKLRILAYYPILSNSLYFHFPELERLWVEGCAQLTMLNLETPSLHKLVLQACSALQEVTLYSENTVAIVPTLSVVRQQGCPQAMSLPQEMKEFLLSHPRVSKLHTTVHATHREARQISDLLKINHSLTTLHIFYSDIGDIGAQYLAEALKINRSLTTLHISYSKIGDISAQYLAEVLKINRSLTTLHIFYSDIGDIGAQYLAEALKINRSLTTLHISHSGIGVIGVQYLAEALKINRSLTTLNLSHNFIKVIGAQYLADALKINRSLTTLHISHSDIGVIGAQYLAEALKINRSLMNLDISDNDIVHIGAQYLAEALKINRSLTTLDLSNNIIGQIGAQYLTEALKINRSLTTLHIFGSVIEKANCKIIEGYLTRNHTLPKAMKSSQSSKHLQPLIHKTLVSHTERDRLQEADSLYTRGLQYNMGERVLPNSMTAAHYFKQAAEIGHGEAQLMLAKAYKFGQGMPVQPLLALFWFARAQENGILLALIEFSRACTDLKVLAKFTAYLNPNKQSNLNWQAEDPFESIPWHTLEKQPYWRNLTHRLMALNTQETDHQVLDAQYTLAQAYKNGEGVPRSSLTATYWCQKAARQCYPSAVNMLKEYHQLLDVDINMLHASSTGALPALWSEVFREIPPIQAVSPPVNSSFQEFNLTNTEIHPHTKRLFTFIEQFVHTTSDRFGYQSMRFEPARLKGLFEQPDVLKALKKEWDQPPSHQGFISSIQMTELHLVHHPALWRRYQERKRRVKAELQECGIFNTTQGVHWQESLSNGLPVLDQMVGEVWLYHGTSEWGVNSILQGGFDPAKYCTYEHVLKIFPRGYGPLGRGTYFTDNFAKAATYVNAMVEDNGAPHHILVCRVLLGQIKTVPKKDRKRCDNIDLPNKGFHSTYGPRQNADPESKFDCNEFCINDGSQIYPEYVIKYTLNPRRDPSPSIKIPNLPSGLFHTSLSNALKQYALNCQYAGLEERIHEFEKLFDIFLIYVQKCPQSELHHYSNLLEHLEKERLSLHPASPQWIPRDSCAGSRRSSLSGLEQEGLETSAVSSSTSQSSAKAPLPK